MLSKYAGYATGAQGLFIVSCGPLVLPYFFLSFVIQCIRRTRLCCSKRLTGKSRKHWLTDTGHSQWKFARSWKWDGVLYSALVWGQVFMIMNVIVGKYINVFLAWLNTECGVLKMNSSSETVGFVLVALVIVAVGMFLFLLPPVPGVPIYLTGGIVLVKAGTYYTNTATGFLEDKDNPYGAHISVGCMCGIALCIKLCACTLQQKCIGGPLRNSVAIRQACGVNSLGARTMRRILSRPGLDMAKVQS